MSRLYLHRESATLRADFSEEGIQMKKQLWGLFCAAVLAATLALPVRAAEQTHRAYLCGYPDGTIRPNARITRAQLACALVRLAEEPLPEPTRVTFFDVPGDHWACTQIRQLGAAAVWRGRLVSAVSHGQLARVVQCAGYAGRLGDGLRSVPGADRRVGREDRPRGGARECRRQRVGQPCRVCACMQQPAWPQSGWERCAAARRGVVLGQSG